MQDTARPLTPRDISIVIPALNEAASIGVAIQSAIDAGVGEIIVSDGGSTDDTLAIARDAGASKLVRSFPGRGTQQNAGAAVATRDVLLFLHADNRLGDDCLNQIAISEDFAWGCFRQRIDSPGRSFRAIEFGNSLRVRVRGMAFGDQAIFVRSNLFRQQGGFPEIPLMEDVELSQRLRRIKRPLLLPGPVIISPRRWEKNGIVRQTLTNWSIQISHAMGTSPEKLARKYK